MIRNRPNYRHLLALLRLILLVLVLAGAIGYGTITSAVALRTQRQQGAGLAANRVPNGPEIPLLGVTTELENQTSIERQAALARLKTDGFGWVRQRIDWGEIEPTQGHFRWQASDALVRDIVASGLVPLVLLDGSPAWARAQIDANNPLAPPEDPQTFAAFAHAFAQRYGDSVRFYQLWDEPNIAPHWGSRWVEPIEYARLLRASGCAIRAADPNAIIISAALAPTTDRGHAAIHETLYIQRLIAATPPAQPLCPTTVPSLSAASQGRAREGLKNKLFDILAIQPYGFGHHPADARQRRDVLNFQRAAHIRRTLVAAGQADVPIWATRFGWNRTQNSPWASVPAARQPEFAAAAILHARANWPWLQALGWHVDQPTAPPIDPVWGFALTDPLAEQIGQAALAPNPTTTVQPTHPLGLWLAPLLMLGLAVGSAWRLPSTSAQIPWRIQLVRLLDNAAIRALLWVVILYAYHKATWPPLILLLWMVAAALLFHTPRDGLLLTAIVLPFHFRQKEIWLFAYPWTIVPAQAMLLCLLPALGRVVFRRWGTIYRTPTVMQFDLFAVGWLLVNLLSFANAWHKPAYMVGLIDLALVPLLLYLATRLLIRTPLQWRQLLVALWIGGVLVALVGWVNWLGGSGPSADGIRRLVGPHYSPNHTALYLERTIFIGAGLLIGAGSVLGLAVRQPHPSPLLPAALYPKGIKEEGTVTGRTTNSDIWLDRVLRLSLSLLLGLLFITILFTASRGALFLGLPAGVVSLYLLTRQNHRPAVPKLSLRALSLSLILSLLLILPIIITYSSRLSNNVTLWRRTQIWQATISLWRDHLWTGVGPGGFYWRYPAYILDQPLLDPNIAHPHNVWLEFGSHWGILGFGWLLGMIGLVVWTARRAMPKETEKPATSTWLSAGIYAGLAASLAHAQVDSFAALADLAGWNWLALGLICQSMWIKKDAEADASTSL